MAVYWILEPVHITVTALMPVFLMPLFGILDASEVCSNYMKEILMMFVGGLAVAVAVEHCGLHERIALKVLKHIGSDAKWLMLGFMLTTMFLSMWISNTATTAMMVPIVDAIMSELRTSNQRAHLTTSTDDLVLIDKNYDKLHMALLLSIAYSANCGGTGTITGTSPNMILKGFIEEMYPETTEVTFASWMLYNIPGMIACVFVGWLLLQLLYLPSCKSKQDDEENKNIKRVISSRLDALGSMTFHEAAVFFLFLLLVFLWIFREPKFMKGWAERISPLAITQQHRIGDAVPVIAIMFLLFLIPAEPWRLGTVEGSPPLLQWSAMQRRLPWGLFILLGGGFALAHGAKASGLSNWLGEQMIQFSFLPPLAVQSILCVLTAALTEVMSNSTVATIFLPIINQMAIAFHVHPLYLMLPVTITCSYAFMLPVATGPNAIVFDTGCMRVVDMIKPGIFMNIICCFIQLIMVNSLGVALFNLKDPTNWSNSTQLLYQNESTIVNYNKTSF
ncbi:Na(+)/citrate cotransporter isoform X2 [Parasteatoda tepidariorum]